MTESASTHDLYRETLVKLERKRLYMFAGSQSSKPHVDVKQDIDTHLVPGQETCNHCL
jgi:hypothetical protein